MQRKAFSKILILCFGVFVVSCSVDRPSEGSRKAGEHIKNLVSATTETEPTPRGKNDDSAKLSPAR